jgi:hypothetical protein
MSDNVSSYFSKNSLFFEILYLKIKIIENKKLNIRIVQFFTYFTFHGLFPHHIIRLKLQHNFQNR